MKWWHAGTRGQRRRHRVEALVFWRLHEADYSWLYILDVLGKRWHRRAVRMKQWIRLGKRLTSKPRGQRVLDRLKININLAATGALFERELKA